MIFLLVMTTELKTAIAVLVAVAMMAIVEIIRAKETVTNTEVIEEEPEDEYYTNLVVDAKGELRKEGERIKH